MELEEGSHGDRAELWAEIRCAERLLVGGMYSRAASTASSVLTALHLTSAEARKLLSWPPERKSIEAERLKEMVEAAGMILLQATNESGKLGSALKKLEEHFEGIEFVPHYLLLPGACLQVSGLLYYPARLALEAFLSRWCPNHGHNSYTKVLEGCTLYLPGDIYGTLAEIYALHVLARGLNQPDVAITWLQRAELEESVKQKILQKTLPPQQEAKGWTVQPEPENSFEDVEYLEDEEKATSLSTRIPPVQSSARIGVAYWWKTLLELCKVFYARALSSTQAMEVIKRVSGSVVLFILSYALLRERNLLKTSIKNGLLRVRGMVTEFWELAFGLQINPLAAVQPLPSGRH